MLRVQRPTPFNVHACSLGAQPSFVVIPSPDQRGCFFRSSSAFPPTEVHQFFDCRPCFRPFRPTDVP